MSPVLKIMSLQWEGKGAYNFSISNCVVSLHADRNLSIISSIFFTIDFPLIWLFFPFYRKLDVYCDIEIMALGRPFHHKNIIFF